MHDDLFRVTGPAGRVGQRILPEAPPGHKWSANLWATTAGDWVALYRPLNLGLLYLQRAQLQNNLLHHPPLLEALKRENFLIPKEHDVDHDEHEKLILRAREGVFRFLCILPTTACNLNCAYCHQRTRPGHEQTMTAAELAAGLRKCAELCSDISIPVDILLYGGEPLKAFSVTEEVLRLTGRGNSLFRQPVRLAFTTSGYGLNEHQAALLAAHEVFVIISLDAPPEVNDPIRRVKGGGSSFALAEQAYHLLKAQGCRVGLSVTMGRHNAETDFAGKLTWLLERFQPDDIGLNAFLHRLNGDPNPFQLGSDQAFSAFIDGFKLTRKYGIYAEQPFRRLKPFAYRRPLLKDCSAPGERLVLAPGGVIGFCDSCFPDKRYFYSPSGFPGKEHPDYLRWAKLSAPEMPQCSQCAAMTVCGGACRYDAYKASGQLDGVEAPRCQFELRFLKWMIWELFALLPPPAAGYGFPTRTDREQLFANSSLNPKNQPFTAGSLAK